MRLVGNLLGVLALVCATPAFADSEQGRGGGQRNGDGGGHGNTSRGGSYGAPEPVTIAALATGAAVAGFVGWRARRKR